MTARDEHQMKVIIESRSAVAALPCPLCRQPAGYYCRAFQAYGASAHYGTGVRLNKAHRERLAAWRSMRTP